MDLEQHLIRQIVFSRATFGPGPRTEGIIDHIKKELVEVEEGNGDPSEWVDVVILALDGLTRALSEELDSNSADVIAYTACSEILGKQRINEARDWPDWRSVPEGQAIEHVRTEAASADE